MSEDRFSTLNTCHAFLNALTSGYSGKARMLEVLSGLNQSLSHSQELAETKSILEDLSAWSRLMWDGQPLELNVSSEDQCDDAKTVIWLAHELKVETYERSARLDALLEFEDIEDNTDAIHELVAALAYQAAARESYVNGLVTYGDMFENDLLEEKWTRELSSCEAQSKRAEKYFERCLEHGTTDLGLLHDLREATLLLPAILRCQVHDLNQILSMTGSDEFTFEDADFDRGEAEYWSEFGFDARAAGYWRAHDLCPEEALLWIECGFSSPTAAGSWRYRGFGPDDAQRWAMQGFNAIQAEFFTSSGCDSPERASSFDEWSH